MAAENETASVKIILVTGSVMSGVGKGIISSSLGVLLKAAGFGVSAIKIDPYLNVDAGTFSPFEHGEVFVLDDGGEVDVDLGNYERFLQVRLSQDHSITTGKIMQQVIHRERAGYYLGKTVKMIPHVTDAIIEWVERVSKISVDGTQQTPDVCIVELGGTIGDAEGVQYSEAFSRAFSRKTARQRFMTVHVTKLLHEETGEIKTKPAQNGIRELRKAGLNPDLLFCRSKKPLSEALRTKIANFSQLEPNEIIDVYDCANIYRVPLILYQQNVLKIMCDQLKLSLGNAPSWLPPPHPQNSALGPNIDKWRKLSELNEIADQQEVKIALVAKYVNVDNEDIYFDAYSSVIKALKHAAVFAERRVHVVFINAEYLEELPAVNGDGCNLLVETNQQKAWQALKECHGILVPGGFGDRGVEGKIEACRHARLNKIPFLGICLGLQCAAIEFARNVLSIAGANSTEFNRELGPEQQVIIDMPEHAAEKYGMGATMRLGKRTTVFLTNNSILAKLYNDTSVDERHRHRFEVNPSMVPKLSRAGLLFVGMGVDETPPSAEQSAAMCGAQRTKSAISLVNLATANPAETNEELLEKIDRLCKRGGDGVKATPIRMEMAEMKRADHPFFVGVQYHPEFLSSPFKPSPPFVGFLLAASSQLNDDFFTSNQENESLIEKLEQLYYGNSLQN